MSDQPCTLVDGDGQPVNLPSPQMLRDRLTAARMTVAQFEGRIAHYLATALEDRPDYFGLEQLLRARLQVELLEQALALNESIHGFLADATRERRTLTLITSDREA